MANFGRKRKTELPDISAIRGIFTYYPSEGHLIWNWREGRKPGMSMFNTMHAGRIAGSPQNRGYLQVAFSYDGTKYKALVHRICFALHNGYFPECVDHINNVRDDNRAVNLRDADASKNQFNRSVVNAKSGLKGVYTHTCSGRFFSQIQIGGKYEFLGTYDCPEECAKAYDAAAIRLFGEFSRTNASMNLIGEK